MIELNELIAYFSGECQKYPPKSPFDRRHIALSTLAYLNGYRVTSAMLQDLAGNAADLEAEARLP